MVFSTFVALIFFISIHKINGAGELQEDGIKAALLEKPLAEHQIQVWIVLLLLALLKQKKTILKTEEL